MYSWEIDKLLISRNYSISASEYINICKGSPQISRIKYNGFDDSFGIETKDNYYWKFSVVRKEENHD